MSKDYKITIPYAIGDKLWCSDHFSYSREVTCLTCKSLGQVLLMDGTTMKCGDCRGCGQHMVHHVSKFRPVYHTITGFDIRNKNGQMVIWYYTDKSTDFVLSNQFITTFREAKKISRQNNEKYGWPKSDDVKNYWPNKHLHFWGYRVK